MCTAYAQKSKNYKIAVHAHSGVDGVPANLIVLIFVHTHYAYREEAEVDAQLHFHRNEKTAHLDLL